MKALYSLECRWEEEFIGHEQGARVQFNIPVRRKAMFKQPMPSSALMPKPTPTPFKVTTIDMAVSPISIAGLSCEINITVTYTATFHIVPNSPSGTIEFLYTWNNGHASPKASITVNPGQTTATYAFTWSGRLFNDHMLPGSGGVMTISPNVISSPLVRPEGLCT